MVLGESCLPLVGISCVDGSCWFLVVLSGSWWFFVFLDFLVVVNDSG